MPFLRKVKIKCLTFWSFSCILFTRAPIFPVCNLKFSPDTIVIPQIFFLIILIIVNALFSAAEAALISLKPVMVEELSKRGMRGRILSQLSADTGRFLATVQIGVTLAGFLASAFASNAFSDPLAKFLDREGGLSFESIDQICVVVITVVLSYFTLVFGELVPKQIALRNTATVALNTAIPVHILSRVTALLVWLLNSSVKLVMKPFRFKSTKDDRQDTEEEIRTLAKMGEKDGVIDANERRIIQKVFDLDDITCGEIMTMRDAVSGIEVGEPPEEIEKRLSENVFSAYPVYQGTIDRVVGILYAVDYFRSKQKNGRSPQPGEVMRKPHFVLVSATVSQVFHDMQKEHFEIAVVQDESGATAGVVTRADLLEELVGSLHSRKPEESLIQISETVWESGGLVRVAELERELGRDLPDEAGRPDTVGGLLTASLGDASKPGSVAEIGGLRFTVQTLDGGRISRVRIDLPEQSN